MNLSKTPNMLKHSSRLKGSSNEEGIDGDQESNILFTQSQHRQEANKTESKRSKQRHLLELRELDKASYISANESKVAELAKLCIEYIRENPGVLREEIIDEIDRRYDSTG